MYNKFLFYFSLSFSLMNCSSGTSLNELEIAKAEYNKQRYGLPTPASYGQLQTETPIEPVAETYLQEWVSDFKKFENQIARLQDGESLGRNNLKEEYDKILESLNDQRCLDKYLIEHKESLKLKKNENIALFNVSNRQIISSGVLNGQSLH